MSHVVQTQVPSPRPAAEALPGRGARELVRNALDEIAQARSMSAPAQPETLARLGRHLRLESALVGGGTLTPSYVRRVVADECGRLIAEASMALADAPPAERHRRTRALQRARRDLLDAVLQR